MHVITRKRLNEFAGRYPETRTALAHWYGLARRNGFSNLAELKATFPSAD
jgi:mRNA interferase HigB